MDFSELLSESLSALTLNKMRTVLATLGIIIGIGAVIALVSLGESGQQSVQNQIQSLGANLLTVTPGAQTSGGIRGAIGSNTSLTYDDAKAILSSPTVNTINNVSPEISRRAQVSNAGNNSNTQVIGATNAYLAVHNLTISTGRFISSDDVGSFTKVAVIGPQVVADLFPTNSEPIGQTVRINKQTYRIIGITQSKGGSGFFNQDDIVFVPLTTAQKIIFGIDYINSISLEAKNQNVMTQAQNQVGYLLLSLHKLSDPAQADFTIVSQADILGAASQITSTFTALLAGIAAISLLVGGIGIMNIMLVTVTERTREIGLRKALGAKKRTVIGQFLTEAVILTIVGGILGMIFGLVISLIISKLINLPFTISLTAVALALAVSGGIGILFGWYPARKAANLSPIEALRYE
ncbi:MAG: ABC transporter permease [Candidatus Gottesmanbacteria bacterium]